MKFDSGRVVIWGTGLWLYAVIVLGLSEIVEISLLLVAGTYIPVIALYLFLLSRENKRLSPKELASRRPQGMLGMRHREYTGRDAVESFIAVFGSVILAIATLILFDPEIKREVTAPWVWCERDASRISTQPINQTIEGANLKITLHNVTYNVPQKSEHPIPYSYRCEKAALVEVTIERIGHKAKWEDISVHDFELQNKDDKSIHPESSDKEYGYYAESKGIVLLRRTIDREASKMHGWLAFSMYDDNPNAGTVFVYEKYEENKSIRLPSSRE